MSSSSSALQRIAVLRLTALGDCVNAFGVIGALRQALPQCRLCFILDQRFAGLFVDAQGQPLCPLVRVDFSTGLRHALCRLQRDLGGQSFDVLLNMQTSIKASLCSLFIHAPRKIGFDAARSRELQGLFVNEHIAPAADEHVLSGFLEFARTLGCASLQPCWDFRLSETELSEARGRFASARKILLLAPCSALPAKNWTLQGYIAVCRYALAELGMQIGLIGDRSPACLQMCSAIAHALDGPVLQLAGCTTLRQLLAVIATADLMLSPDSGPMHMASALGIPVIGLFAVHSERRVGAYNFPDLCVSVYEQAARSELRGPPQAWRYRVRNPHAMELITPAMVCSMLAAAWERYVAAGTSYAT